MMGNAAICTGAHNSHRFAMALAVPPRSPEHNDVILPMWAMSSGPRMSSQVYITRMVRPPA